MSWFTLRSLRLAVLVSVVTLTAPGAALAKTEIYWWHALQATLGERVNEIATKFNASQNDYEVKAIFKGSYPETLNAAIAAYRAKQAPHVVQVYEVGTQTMLSSGAVYPVFQLMKDNNVAIDWNDLIGPVKTYYSSGGNLYSMAFNSSTPILYYNKDLFKKAGLPDKAPATWDEVEAMAKKLVASRRQVRLQHRVAVVGHHGDDARLPRPAVRRSRQRLRRPGHQSQDQRRLRREDARAPAARRQGRLVHLQRPAQQGRGQHGRRRVRDLHHVVGLHRQHHQDRRGQVRVGHGAAAAHGRLPARATPSSAAPRCG